MSHLGKKPIEIPEGLTVEMTDGVLNFSGEKGKLSQAVLPFLKVEIVEKEITVKPTSEDKQAKANWGTMAALIRNALNDIKNSFSKSLIIEGVGYRANVSGDKITVNAGYSHPVERQIPEGVSIEVEKNVIRLTGVDRQLVGRFAAEIRSIRKPEPYKGTGIRYSDEVIRRKAGKKAVTAA